MYEKVKAYLFIRAASPFQVEAEFKAQEVKLREYCQKYEYEVVGITKVQCSSSESVTHLDDILNKVDAGLNFQILLAVNHLRFSREESVQCVYEEKFRERNIALLSIQKRKPLFSPTQLIKLSYELSSKVCEHCGQDKWEANGCFRGPLIHNGMEYEPVPIILVTQRKNFGKNIQRCVALAAAPRRDIIIMQGAILKYVLYAT